MAWPDLHTAVYTLLTGTAAITAIVDRKIYAEQAPAGTVLPYIIFYEAVGLSPNVCPRETLDSVYRVESRRKVRGAGATIETLHSAVYSAFHKQTLAITGWYNYRTVCERQQKFTDTLSGEQIYRYIWDIRIQASEN